MIYSQNGLNFTEQFEGCRTVAYLDQGGTPTIGYGHTSGVSLGDKCTQEQAEKWLLEDVQEAARTVNAVVKVPLDQNQFDALVDFVFNIGSGNFESSTFLRLLNEGDRVGASEQFERWNKSGGVIRDGLIKRRIAEENLFLT